VQVEIANWLKDPRGVNTEAQQIVSRVSQGICDQVSTFDVSQAPRWIPLGLAYYVNLLGLRRETVTAVQSEIAEHSGTQPSRQNVNNLVKTRFGERGSRLAKNSDRHGQPDHRYNDEAIVMFAITHALMSGQETIILTHDEKVFEQFYKAVWLVDTHWHSMLMADLFAKDPLAFAPLRHASDAPERVVRVLEQVFDLSTADAVFMNKPSPELREILPSGLTTVPIQCVLIKERVHVMKFGLVQEMEAIYRTKVACDWRNTGSLEDRNFHVSLGPVAYEIGNWAAVAKDLTGSKGFFKYSIVDVNLALFAAEPVQHIRPTSLIIPGKMVSWDG
jgi:hypothetical protein